MDQFESIYKRVEPSEFVKNNPDAVMFGAEHKLRAYKLKKKIESLELECEEIKEGLALRFESNEFFWFMFMRSSFFRTLYFYFLKFLELVMVLSFLGFPIAYAFIYWIYDLDITWMSFVPSIISALLFMLIQELEEISYRKMYLKHLRIANNHQLKYENNRGYSSIFEKGIMCYFGTLYLSRKIRKIFRLKNKIVKMYLIEINR